MSELKNKDGIPIRVGQMWKNVGVSNAKFEVRDLTQRQIVTLTHGGVLDGDFEFELLSIWNEYYELMYDPQWGDMSESRIVTDKDRKNHTPCDGVEVQLASGRWYTIAADGYGDWQDGVDYRVPRDFEWPKAYATQEKNSQIDRVKCEKIDPLDVASCSQHARKFEAKINELVDAVNALLDNKGEQ